MEGTHKDYRITESLRLENASKIMESKSWPCTGYLNSPAQCIPENIVQMFLELW